MRNSLHDHDKKVRRPRRNTALRIARTSVGLGVFARRRYDCEEIVGEVTGKVIDDAEYSSDYCMDLGDTRCIEPEAPFRYMNHSCDPNCRFHWYDVREDGIPDQSRRVFVFAERDIEVGEELTIDYAWPAAMAIACQCKSPECRGWVVAESEVPHVDVANRAE